MTSRPPYHTVYEPNQIYSQSITLSPGQYRLYHGLQFNLAEPTTGWSGSGWVDIVGELDRRYVKVTDTRANPDTTRRFDDGRSTAGAFLLFERFVILLFEGFLLMHPCSRAAIGCAVHELQCAAGVECTCPLGQFFWDSTVFDIGFGKGGAVAAVGTGEIQLRDSVFGESEAGVGSSLFVISATSVEISNTTFSSTAAGDNTHHIKTFGDVTMLDCNSLACDPGERCLFRDKSRFCVACGQNERGDGQACTGCPPGTEPSASGVHLPPTP